MRSQWQPVITIQIILAVFFVCIASYTALSLYAQPFDDLPTFFWSTQLAFEQGVSAYQPHYFRELGTTLGRKVYPFLYPPPSLLIFSPFLLGDYEQSKIAITVCNVMIWCICAVLAYRLFCFYARYKSSFIASLLIPLWILFFAPIVDTLRTGQIDLFVLLCVAPLFFNLKSRWQITASGVLLAIAITLKIYLLLLLPVLIIARSWQLLATSLFVLLLFVLLSLFLLPQQLWLDWLTLGEGSGGYARQIPNLMTIPWNQSINGFFIRQFLDDGVLGKSHEWAWLIYFTAICVLLVSFFMVVHYLRQSAQGLSRAIAFMLLTITLVAPLTWLHHFVFALPAIVCCYAELLKLTSRIKRSMLAALLTFAVMLMSQPFLANLVAPTLAGQAISDNTISLGFNLFLSVQLLAAMGVFLVFVLATICTKTLAPMSAKT